MTKILLSLLGCVSLPFIATAQTTSPTRAALVSGADPQTLVHLNQRVQTSNFRRTRAELQRIPGSNWTTNRRTSYSSFTSSNQPRIIQLDSMNGATLVMPLQQSRLRYNAAGFPTTDSLYSWSVANQRYTPARLAAYTYTTRDSVAQETISERGTGGVLLPFDRLTHTYDPVSGRRTQILYESYDRSWSAYGRDVYTYDAQGRISRIELFASVLGGAFSPFLRQTYTYNAQGRLQTALMELAGSTGAYSGLFRSTFTYSTGGQLSTMQVERWISSSSTWQPSTQTLYAYDTDGNVASETNQKFAGGSYANANRLLYTYQRVLAGTAARGLNAGLRVFPNPAATGEATISYQLRQAAPVSVEVLDVMGRVVAAPLSAKYQPAGEQQAALATTLRPGIYTVRLRVGQNRETQKLVVR
jgi:hypothetical protein